MNWAALFSGLAFIVFAGLGLAAMTIVLNVMFSSFITRARDTAERMPLRSALVGFINFAFFGILSIAVLSVGQWAETHVSTGSAGLLRFIGVLIILLLLTFIAFGITAIARWVGERLVPNATATRQALSGIVALEVSSLTPLIGWIFVPLAVLFLGYGAVIIALVWRRNPNLQSPVSSL